MKRLDSVWFIHFLMKKPDIISNLHFIAESKHYDNSIIISSNDSENISFKFYKNNKTLHTVEEAYLDIKENPNVSLYMEINFPGVIYSDEYAEVLSETNDMTHLSLDEEEDINDLLEENSFLFKQLQLEELEKEKVKQK